MALQTMCRHGEPPQADILDTFAASKHPSYFSAGDSTTVMRIDIATRSSDLELLQ